MHLTGVAHDLPPYRVVFRFFRLWQAVVTWEAIHADLLEAVRLVVMSAAVHDWVGTREVMQAKLAAHPSGRECGRDRAPRLGRDGNVGLNPWKPA